MLAKVRSYGEDNMVLFETNGSRIMRCHVGTPSRPVYHVFNVFFQLLFSGVTTVEQNTFCFNHKWNRLMHKTKNTNFTGNSLSQIFEMLSFHIQLAFTQN